MYHPTTRVLTVLEVLEARGRASGPELARRLEVSQRTVRRYVTMLQDLGVPVASEPGRHGGYRLLPGYKLPPLMLSDDEALAVTLGLLLARRMGLTATASASDSALAKIERVLPRGLREQVQAVQSALALTVPASDAAETDTVVALSLAAQQGRRVRLRYGGWNRRETEREVDPWGLAFIAPRWYLAGYCHLRQDERVFRLDRISALALTETAFTPPAEFDAADFVTRSLATMPGIWRVDVLLDAPLAEAQARIPPTHGTLEVAADGLHLRCTADDLAGLARFLVGLDLLLTVLAPTPLQEELRRLAGAVARMAGPVPIGLDEENSTVHP